MFQGFDLGHFHIVIAAIIGLGFGALALVLGQHVFARKKVPSKFPAASSAQDSKPKKESLHSEKREAYRRSGRYVQVEMCRELGKNCRISPGLVLDRSMGGIRISLEEDFPSGIKMYIRVANQKPPMPWQEIEVRHCKPAGNEYEMGAKFVNTLSYNLLVMFG